MPDELETQWECVREELRATAPELTYHLWLHPLELAGREGDTLFVRAAEHQRSWIRERHGGLLTSAASRALGADVAIEIVDPSWTPPEDHRAASALAKGGERLNPKYTFDQFVIGHGNRLAHAAALAVAEMPSQAYNPLFLYGPPGLGKTHLLHAIGNYLLLHGAGLAVRYTTIESFTSGFLSALRQKDTAAFKDALRSTDVLLIDDIQFLAGKERTEEEFFHTFNALYETGRQLVITSDRAPGDMTDFESRLLERFGSGLVAELEAPDYDVRLAILRKRARLDALGEVSPETLEEIARHLSASVRTLEGALIRVVALASLRSETPTPELARRVLGRLYPRVATPRRSVDAIVNATAEAFELSPEVLARRDRQAAHSWPRQVAMYLARELTTESLPSIGRHLGGRNHTTVLHAHRRVTQAVETGGPDAARVLELRRRLGNPA
jgi:chromosomal replication initiator protein